MVGIISRRRRREKRREREREREEAGRLLMEEEGEDSGVEMVEVGLPNSVEQIASSRSPEEVRVVPKRRTRSRIVLNVDTLSIGIEAEEREEGRRQWDLAAAL